MRRYLFGALIALAMVPTGAGAQTATMGFADAAQAFSQACSRDIDRFCRQANLGGGRIEACLQENSARVSAGCRTAVSQIRTRVAARLQAQQGVFRTCESASARRVMKAGSVLTMIGDDSSAADGSRARSSRLNSVRIVCL